ncbi:hypothetical protein M422DRAFT_782048 [Sphaerobolus stellatus SS14]|uniref:Uncharacterized protein n=1 Tax=Sphaerobolus stellatus (strain SS14) TaxID=990650 RepID=A0A0C9V5P5_SPHS4|nr:hypothetical protein M422DRAFT_782048 [Sphaerobolus stellatus SS14]
MVILSAVPRTVSAANIPANIAHSTRASSGSKAAREVFCSNGALDKVFNQTGLKGFAISTEESWSRKNSAGYSFLDYMQFGGGNGTIMPEGFGWFSKELNAIAPNNIFTPDKRFSNLPYYFWKLSNATGMNGTGVIGTKDSLTLSAHASPVVFLTICDICDATSPDGIVAKGCTFEETGATNASFSPSCLFMSSADAGIPPATLKPCNYSSSEMHFSIHAIPLNEAT